MWRETGIVCILSVFVIALTLSSGCTQFSPNGTMTDKVGIQFYDTYDKDGIAMSNPTRIKPLLPVYVNGTPYFESAIAVRVNRGDAPVVGRNVTLEIWNKSYTCKIRETSTEEGYSSFFVLGDIPSDTDSYFYRSYLEADTSASTESRELVFSRSVPSSEDGTKKVNFERIELVSGSGYAAPTAHIIHTVFAKQRMNDTYSLAVQDNDGKVMTEETGSISLEAGSEKTVTVDNPLNISAVFTSLRINLTLTPSMTVETSMVFFSKPDLTALDPDAPIRSIPLSQILPSVDLTGGKIGPNIFVPPPIVVNPSPLVGSTDIRNPEGPENPVVDKLGPAASVTVPEPDTAMTVGILLIIAVIFLMAFRK